MARMKRHKGNPKPQKGFGFPQHLRKREREKTAPTKIPNTQKRDGRRDNKHLGIQGSGPKGRQTKQHSNPRDQKTQQSTQHPSQRNLTKTKHKTSKVSEDLSPQGGGAHGPPCPLGESPQGTVVPRGPKTPPPREPPPEAQSMTNTKQSNKYPKR